jgi:hypothetical protein
MDSRGEGETRADVARRFGLPGGDPDASPDAEPENDWGWSEEDPNAAAHADDTESDTGPGADPGERA